MNVGDIKLRVKRQFGDESAVQLTDADILRWVNDAQREIAMQNDLLQTVATAAATANTAEYVLPGDLLTLRSVRFNNRKLQVLSQEDADEQIVAYENPAGYTTGTPIYFWIYANRFTLYPTPDSSGATLLKVYYTRIPTQVALDTDIPELALKYHGRIVEYILAQAYEMDEDWTSAGNKSAQLVAGLNSLKESDTWTERSNYPTITILDDDAW